MHFRKQTNGLMVAERWRGAMSDVSAFLNVYQLPRGLVADPVFRAIVRGYRLDTLDRFFWITDVIPVRHQHGRTVREHYLLRLVRGRIFCKNTLWATLEAAVIRLDTYGRAGPHEWQLLRNLIQFLFEYGALRGTRLRSILREFNIRWYSYRQL